MHLRSSLSFVRMQPALILSAIVSVLLSFSGCYFGLEPSYPTSEVVQDIYWKHDASGFVAIKSIPQKSAYDLNYKAIWYDVSGKQLSSFDLPSLAYYTTVGLASDDRSIIYWHDSSTYLMGTDGTSNLILTGEQAIALSPNGALLLTIRARTYNSYANVYAHVSIWDVHDASTPKLLKRWTEIGLLNGVRQGSFLSDSLMSLIIADTNNVLNINVLDTSLRAIASVPNLLPYSGLPIGYSPLINAVFAENFTSDREMVTKLDLASGVPSTFIDSASAATFAPDGTFIVYNALLGGTYLYDVASGSRRKLMNDTFETGSISPDEKYLAYAAYSGNAKPLRVIALK